MQSNELITETTRNESHLNQLASVGQIAAGIAHEVRNPLTAVKGFLQLMKSNPEEKYLEIAQSELNNALATLENLLQVSKPDLEDEAQQSIFLAVELELILQLFQDQFYRVQLETNLQDENACIFGKKNQMKKAFFNLLKNAFEAIPEKGAISITHFANGRDLVIIISDTGIGIPEEKRRLIGTPFFTTKMEGTGMGLTQVFSVIYQHGGHIEVESQEGVGTTFKITLPIQTQKQAERLNEMNLKFATDVTLKEFFADNKTKFEDQLLAYAVHVRDKIEEIQSVGHINLMSNAHKLVSYLVDGREDNIKAFAKDEGEAWAKYSLTLVFKLEWVQSIRRTVWDFLYNYDRLGDTPMSREQFYSMEKNINSLVDLFLNYFFISYSKYKDELIRSHREMVENLSVPIIPLTGSMCILPLVGTVDTFRANLIVDKVLHQIGANQTQTLIMDLSGVVFMDTGVVHHLLKVIDGIALMGCKTVITGIRPEIVKTLIKLGISFSDRVETKGTLQQALSVYLADKGK